MTAVLAILGIAVFALPTAILDAGLVEEFAQRHNTSETCRIVEELSPPRGSQR